ncbi:MAG: hypothetical protein DCC58_02505 [Chloroflexi bacterium]|nr:MAG: hypothetical protein DCC58_02505 [Chloroflexota bacterium]
MRAQAMRTTEVGDGQLGWVLAHDLEASDGRVLLNKGAVLDEAALKHFQSASPGEVHLLELEADELHENAAGLRIAQAAAGDGIGISGPLTSRYDLLAERKGLLRVDAGLLRAINRVEDVTVYTLLDRQPVLPGAVLASVKVTPIAMPEARVAEVEALCRAQPLLRVLPFQPKRVAVLALEALAGEQRSRFEAVIDKKLRWYGSHLIDLRYVAPQTELVAETLRAFLSSGAELILAAGGNPIDPLDPLEQALPAVDARFVHKGAPTRGSMSWLARAGDVPIYNLASCRMWTGNTVADLVLPLLLTSSEVTPDDIREIGYGGLLGTAMAFRFPPYDRDSGDIVAGSER